MAKQSHTPSRRAMLAGLAAAPVAGLPAIALASRLLQKRSQGQSSATRRPILLYRSKPSTDYKTVDALYFALVAAWDELSLAPCASDAELLVKLKYLFRFECDFLGCRPELSDEFGNRPARAGPASERGGGAVMSMANDNAASAPLFIELRPGMRKALADAVEAFVALSTRSTPTPILRTLTRRKTTRHARTWATTSRAWERRAPSTFRTSALGRRR